MPYQQQYHTWLYEEISIIKPNKLALVKHRQTGQLAVKKLMSVTLRSIYEQLSRIRQQNIPVIYNIVTIDEATIAVYQEYVNGQTLQSMLDDQYAFKEKEMLGIIVQLCYGLIAIHAQEPCIVHRDIKPSNVMLSKDGVIKLIDFDAARAYKPDANADTVHIGTHGYAAPEQYGFGQTDARTDIYGVGKLMESLLPEHNSKAYRRVVKTCTAMDANDRYPSAQRLLQAVQHANHVTQYRMIESIAASVLVLGVAVWIAFSIPSRPASNPSNPSPIVTQAPVITPYASTPPVLATYTDASNIGALLQHPYIMYQLQAIMPRDDYSYFCEIFHDRTPSYEYYDTADALLLYRNNGGYTDVALYPETDLTAACGTPAFCRPCTPTNTGQSCRVPQ